MLKIWISSLMLLVALSGCTTGEATNELLTASLQSTDDRPSDHPLAVAKGHYEKGSYGLSERHYRAATEANPHSIDAWLGLAASYDRLARFELAERAYDRAIKLGGRSPTVLNNIGYHHLLRGNLKVAHGNFEEARRIDPSNAVVLGNLQLLATWKTASPGAD